MREDAHDRAGFRPRPAAPFAVRPRARRSALQQRLADVGAWAGTPDGVYGPQTAASVRAWQNKQGIPANGICDEAAWNQLFPEAANANADRIGRMIGSLLANHRRFPGGCEWRLAPDGIQIAGNPARGTGAVDHGPTADDQVSAHVSALSTGQVCPDSGVFDEAHRNEHDEQLPHNSPRALLPGRRRKLRLLR